MRLNPSNRDCRGLDDQRYHSHGTLSHIIYAECFSTVRCISRSHIAWNNCRRWPMTTAKFKVILYP